MSPNKQKPGYCVWDSGSEEGKVGGNLVSPGFPRQVLCGFRLQAISLRLLTPGNYVEASDPRQLSYGF